MMRQMREATKPIMLFTAIAFVALMVFQWGMDITGQSGGGLGEIGSVNGQPVMYDSYMAAYRQLYDQVQRSQEELISSQQNKHAVYTIVHNGDSGISVSFEQKAFVVNQRGNIVLQAVLAVDHDSPSPK